jgi:beta-glucosidase
MNRALLTLLALAACTSRPGLDGDMPDLTTLGKTLPAGFLIGTATAAHQIEGANNNDWTAWEATPGHIANGDTSQVADGSWTDAGFDQDVAAMQALHVNAYRFSIEWSRIQPAADSSFDERALQTYADRAHRLRAAGIRPMVTLMHFTLPKWAAEAGGWTNADTITQFEAFVRHVVPVLAPDVDLWCTVNEPNVYAVSAYLNGNYPPGEKDANADMASVFLNLLKAHAAAAKAIHELEPGAQVGVAHHVRIFQPATSSALDTAIAGLSDDFFNESVPRANATGRVKLYQPGAFDIDELVPGLQGSFDYLGINYYTRDTVRADLASATFSNLYVPDGRPTNDEGWDIYPDGLYIFLTRFQAYGVPMIVTENGIADHEGSTRPKYLAQHIDALERAVHDGADVRGYFHWSLMDNFEWDSGYTPRFGIYRVDVNTDPQLVRQPTPAVATFKQIADNVTGH